MKKIDNIIDQTRTILKEHHLCDNCLGRIFAPKLGLVSYKKLGNKIRNILKQKNPKSCYICKNLMSKLDLQLSKMLSMSKEYEFSSFLIGAILQPSILDRDDLIRSKFKLKGIHSIKNDITREMGKRFGQSKRGHGQNSSHETLAGSGRATAETVHTTPQNVTG